MDPERVQGRVSLLDDPLVRGQVTRISDAAFSCLTRIQSINFSALERSSTGQDTRALWEDVSSQISSMWLAVEELESTLAPLIEEHEAKQADEGEDFDFDFGESDTPVAEKAPAAPLTPLERIGETAWATCFVLNGEIQQFRRRLPNLLQVEDAWDLISDLQDHVGHVKAAINAILTGVFSSLPVDERESGETGHTLELVASRELRIRVFELRDQIVRIEGQMERWPAHEWEKFLRLALQMIERFMFGPGFAWMRAADKRTFITQHRALSELLEIWSPLRAVPAKRVVSNVARYLEALEVINQREHLVTHDRTCLEIVVDNLGAAQAGAEPTSRRSAIAAALGALAEVQGRDRELDRLLEATLDPGSEVPEKAILEVASAVLAKLRG
ncbi:MAG: hypothetical protein AAF654_02600 [Myxococcota bacterium]